jgi:hypothetical protein
MFYHFIETFHYQFVLRIDSKEYMFNLDYCSGFCYSQLKCTRQVECDSSWTPAPYIECPGNFTFSFYYRSMLFMFFFVQNYLRSFPIEDYQMEEQMSLLLEHLFLIKQAQHWILHWRCANLMIWVLQQLVWLWQQWRVRLLRTLQVKWLHCPFSNSSFLYIYIIFCYSLYYRYCISDYSLQRFSIWCGKSFAIRILRYIFLVNMPLQVNCFYLLITGFVSLNEKIVLNQICKIAVKTVAFESQVQFP